MKKSELKQLIKEEIRKVVSEKQTTNEILGFSEREKEVKRMKEDFNKAREEIKNFNPLDLFYELGDHGIRAERMIEKDPDIIDKTDKILSRRFKEKFPTLLKIKMNRKDYYYDKIFEKGIVKVTTERNGKKVYGLTLNLQNISPGYGNYNPIDKKAFEDFNIARIDDAERILMRKKGGKFLDRT